MKILTFDVEEWFHLLDLKSDNTSKQWKEYEVRIHQNVERILDILDSTQTKATFFIVGWIAQEYPEIVRLIASKYEVGTHSMNHQLVHHQTRDEFKSDLMNSIDVLQDITGKKVRSFRAPGFSIRESEPWAFEVLAECGIEIDCSVFPAHHAHGGMPSFKYAVPSIIEYNGVSLKEFPITPVNIAGRNFIYSGGGYFRLLPYQLIKYFSSKQSYTMSYIHPRDLDPGQPVIKGLSIARRFKSYYGLRNAENKLKKWLEECEFTDIATFDKSINWDEATLVKLR
jgi:polysaccharide deacetylase family protein (PEP-CTERM system associated)